MAYKREEQKIYPGGINYLAPPDQVADGDCLQLQNFRCDSAGKLVQNFVVIPQITDEGAYNFDSLLRIKAERYYGGAGGIWKVGTRGAPDPPGALEALYDGLPLGMIGFQNFAWIMNRATGRQRKIKHGTATPYNWTTETPTIPGAAGGAGGSLPAGDTDYYVTFTTADNHESNLSPVRAITVVAGTQTYTITRPAATEAIVSGWHVYRKSPALAVPYRVTVTPIAYATATFVDDGTGTKADAAIQELNEVHSGDHDPAPAATVMADKPHNGRLLVANSAAHPNRVWYTPALEPWYFPGSANEQDGNWVDVGEDDAVLAITVKTGVTIFYKERSIWRCVGDIDDGKIEIVAPDMGTVGYRAVAATSMGDYFVGREGLGICTGDYARKFAPSAKLDPLFRGLTADIAYGISVSGIDPSYRNRCAIGHRNGRLWFSYTSKASATHRPDVTMLIDTASGRISTREGGWSCFYDEGQGADFVGGQNGFIEALENPVFTDVVAWTMELGYHSRYEDQGHPGRLKTYQDIEIRHNTQDAPLTVKVFVNNGRLATDEVAIGTLQSTVETRSVFRLEYPAGYSVVAKRGLPLDPAFNLAVRIDGDNKYGATLPVEIFGPIILHYFVEPRKARTFDSDETDLGVQEVKTIDQIELDIDNPDVAATLQLYSDIPGGAMAARLGAGVTIATTTTRKAIIVPLSSPVDGRLLRTTLIITGTTPTQGFLLYGVRLRVYRTGEYLDGTNTGEKWAPLPISIGV
jgi:hypothetical protein